MNQSLHPSYGLVLEADGRSLDDVKGVRSLLREHGCLLFRGFRADLETFKQFSHQYSDKFSDYEGGVFRIGSLNRDKIDNDPTLLTTTGHTQGFPISLHGEMHYLKNPPHILWFYCQTPSAKNGQTTVCHGRTLWEAFSPETKSYFQENKIRYIRYLPDGDWQSTFGTDDLEQVATVCAHQGMTWTHHAESGELITHFDGSAVTREGVFINNILPVCDSEWAFESGWMKEHLSELGERAKPPLVVRTTEGEKLPEEIMTDVRRAAELHTVNIEWEAGDIVMIDNHRVMHGRRKTSDPARSILVRMGSLREEPVGVA